jgi:cell division transport system permease protein
MTTFFRAIYWGLKSFFRHFGLSFITILIITFSLFSLTTLLFLNIISDILLKNLEGKIDINIYLKDNLTENEIKDFKNSLANEPGVKEIIYISPEEALERFKEKHKKDEVILKSLEILDKNPLGGLIVLRARSLQDYSFLLNRVSDPKYEKFIEEKDFQEYEKIILTIKNISSKIRYSTLLIVGIFTLISIVAIFNSIRLAIYKRDEEIKIMRLIGATASFARTPFIVESVFYGLFAWLINLLIFFIIFKFGFQRILNFLEIEENLFFSYQKEIIYSFVGVLIFSIFLTILSSWLAVRKYIKI